MKRLLFFVFIGFFVISMYVSSVFYIRELTHIYPTVPRINLRYIIEKPVDELTEEDFSTIFEQSGLGKQGYLSLKDKYELLLFQENFYKPVEINRIRTSIVTCEENVVEKNVKFAPLQVGDIFVTNSAYFLSWRNGHAGIVVDDVNMKTLEATLIGEHTTILNADKWKKYPNFTILRLKGVSKEEREKIAKTALENLNDMPYKLFVGISPFKKTDFIELSEVTGTQCAHLVWLAYASCGYDIDGNGGIIVTPHDIVTSELLEVVQVYG